MALQAPRWLNGRLLIGLWLLTMSFAYFGLGGYLQERVEGIDANQIPLWPTVVFGLLALHSLALTIWWAATLRTPSDASTPVPAADAPPAGLRSPAVSSAPPAQ